MKLRLVVDLTVHAGSPWYRLEKLTDNRGWTLITSGFEPFVREIFERIKTERAETVVVEEWETPIGDAPGSPAK